MTLEEAGIKLREMYDAAPNGEQVVYIHLFGIKYANQPGSLINKEIVRQAKMKESYGTEVAKGRKLAKYVRLKED